MLFPILAEWDWTSPKLPFDEWWFFGVVLVLLVIFIWAVARLLMPTTDDVDPAEVDRQMLTAVNELRTQGELTDEEFRSIKSRLVKRLATEEGLKLPAEIAAEVVTENGEIKGSEGDETGANPVPTSKPPLSDSDVITDKVSEKPNPPESDTV